MTALVEKPGVGPLLKDWRTRRRVSQLELSSETGVSTRHLSFIETGRSQPSREMVMRLAEYLELPLRDRNAMLLSAGFAPEYAQTPLSAESMRDVRTSLQRLMDAHRPCPAMAVDPLWNLVLINDSALQMADGLPEDLLEEPINIIRLLLHPDGLAKLIVNFDVYSAYLLQRMRRQFRATGDARVRGLLDEFEAYPGVTHPTGTSLTIAPEFKIRQADDGPVLTFFTIISTLGTPYDVTLDEIVIESLFPADAQTAAAIGMQPAA
jgi:transcriptional regulator with XRE-family HTH domain